MAIYKNISKVVYFESLTTAGAANTGTTPSLTVSKDSGAQAAATNAPAHLGNGQWWVTLTATEMNADVVALGHTAASCVPGTVLLYTESDYTATVAGRIDAAITSRMASYAQPGGFLAATFPGTVASPTNITAATGVVLSAAGVQAIWDALTSALTTVGSVGKRIADFITGDAYVRLGAPAGASTAADIAAVKTDTAAVKVQTDKLAFTVANQVDSNVIDWKSAVAPAMTGDAFARLGVPAGASTAADIAATKALLPTALVGGRMDAAVGVMASGVIGSATLQVDTIDAAALANSAAVEIAVAVLASIVEGSTSLKQILQDIGAATAGKNTGAGTGTVTFRNVSDTVNALVATIDGSNNRTAITRTRT